MISLTKKLKIDQNQNQHPSPYTKTSMIIPKNVLTPRPIPWQQQSWVEKQNFLNDNNTEILTSINYYMIRRYWRVLLLLQHAVDNEHAIDCSLWCTAVAALCCLKYCQVVKIVGTWTQQYALYVAVPGILFIVMVGSSRQVQSVGAAYTRRCCVGCTYISDHASYINNIPTRTHGEYQKGNHVYDRNNSHATNGVLDGGRLLELVNVSSSPSTTPCIGSKSCVSSRRAWYPLWAEVVGPLDLHFNV